MIILPFLEFAIYFGFISVAQCWIRVKRYTGVSQHQTTATLIALTESRLTRVNSLLSTDRITSDRLTTVFISDPFWVCRYALIKILAECMPSNSIFESLFRHKMHETINFPSFYHCHTVYNHAAQRDCISKIYFKAPMNSTLLRTKFNLVVKMSRQDQTQLHTTRTDISHTSLPFTATHLFLW